MNSPETIDELTCPICLEIPTDQVFQCKRGHIVCGQCLTSLEECPVCRTPYGQDKIRNILVEFILSKMEFPCPNIDLGCGEILGRSCIQAHFKTCQFTVATVHLCKMIGYNCPFQFKSNDVDSFQAHLKSEHGSLIYVGDGVNITLDKFQQSSSSTMWSPILLQTTFLDSQAIKRYLILSRYDSSNNSLAWTCLLLEDVGNDVEFNDRIEFTISSVNKPGQDLEWRQQCIRAFEAEKILAGRPIQVSVAHLEEGYVENGMLTVRVSLQTKSSEENQRSEHATLLTLSSPIEVQPVRRVASNDLEEAPEEEDNVTIFRDASCILCSKTRLRDVVFLCLQCPNVPFCKDCFSPSTHPKHVFAQIRTVEQLAILDKLTNNWTKSVLPHGEYNNNGDVWGTSVRVFYNAKCDRCRRNPIVRTRFKCLQCKSYDLCETCCATGDHSHHIFGVITNHSHNEFIGRALDSSAPLIK